GEVRLRQWDLEGAVADFTEALKLRPRHAGALLNRGVAQRRRGDLDAALADFGAALEADPNDVAARYDRGCLRVERGDLGGALAAAGRFPEAVERQRRAVELTAEGEQEGLRARLALYETGQAYRESGPTGGTS